MITVMFNVPVFQFLTAALIAGVLGFSGYVISPLVVTQPINVYLEPKSGMVVIGETFTVDIYVHSSIPVNVFQGLLQFSSDKLAVQKIDYNTSIANLWAEEPWYSNGDGTINFIGGSTRSGGYTGTGSLMTITFITKNTGEATIAMSEMRILKHDGVGTEVPLPTPIDALFAVASETLSEQIVLGTEVPGPVVTVVNEIMNTDLNNDGKQSLSDISIFMSDLFSKNLRSDFNQDGIVNLKDLSILNR
jgi:hypothetical protein